MNLVTLVSIAVATVCCRTYRPSSPALSDGASPAPYDLSIASKELPALEEAFVPISSRYWPMLDSIWRAEQRQSVFADRICTQE